MKYCIAFVLCALVAGCMSGGSSRVPVPPPEYYAAEDYNRIVQNANHVLSTDWLGWVPGMAEPDRVPANCKDARCSIGFSAFLSANRSFGVKVEDIELLADTNGIRTVARQASREFSDIHGYGGWMQHSFFTSTTWIFTNELDPDEGVVRVAAYANGYSTRTNPETEATWTGFVSARDRSAATDTESVVTGDASISVSLGAQMLADVYLTGMANVTTGQAYADVTYEDLVVTDGQFGRRHADNERLSGVFYGPGHEEVGGVFEDPQGLLGAYGGARQ